ncbi:alpha-xenorhabdolysin family binary toxin subunit B [Pseudomonas rubra]|uniref:Alpha-xenorhabdolysin family binary toxin subunit B n=1 Tax=Pseudomonas rubra TaxID=2942627 RepID=A0ABT5PCA1_9PSED|nr:alpha-xenorhabdolysin family binary toxin subunit B [Pseudomonas rubra]MDD1015850.1 alpha-xenorhabdolysin family binary toxin subunit B [Pseudomonas rubra]MDD1036773.1 alpha-xenorhabdolysin family binary toxin subunit B [Pseudomonas rubra]MDD1157260.1 alpha-xenorhabdolysin family binary toxin subunit B [Pseudomonas rubra]
MNDNVVALNLNVELKAPDMDVLLAPVSAYAALWAQRTFAFLPLLHESIERHYKGFQKYVDSLAKNAEVLAVTIKSHQLDALLDELRESQEDPEEQEFYLEELQTSKNKIATALDAVVSGVMTASKSIGSLPVYDVARDQARYLETHERLAISLQALAVTLSAKRENLAELENAISVFEANGIEKLFEGKLPTVEQLQGLVAQGSTTAGAAAAVEQALAALAKLMDGVQQGMRYSRLQDQRRALRAEANELIAEQREKEQRAKQVQANLQSLSEYSALYPKRQGWLAEKQQIRVQLETLANQMRRMNLNSYAKAQLLNRLLKQLVSYLQDVVLKFRQAF